jgi:tetratricopeptide (TPR) repeat protein
VRLCVLLFALELAFSPPVAAQAPVPTKRPSSTPDDLFTRPASLRDGIGRAHDEVATRSPEAQAFYDQGLAFLHSLAWTEAARSFNQALRIDPRLAVAHAALSQALARLNRPAEARAALERALDVEPSAPDHDRIHIELRALQIEAEISGASVAAGAYRNALDTALARFPADVELWVLRGVAQSPEAAGGGGETVAGTSIAFLEKALELSPGYPAAHHYLAHAYENTGQVMDALRHAQEYGRLAPSSPHARHVQGHALRLAGRVGEAVEAFEAADRLHAGSLERDGIPAAYASDYAHNRHQLGACYRYLGRMADAARALEGAFAIPSSGADALEKSAWPDLLISRGRRVEAIAAARSLVAGPSALARAVGHVAAGQALLAGGDLRAAAGEERAARAELVAAGQAAAPAAPSLEALQGELLLRGGAREMGRAMLDEVIRTFREAAHPEDWARTLFAIEAVARTARDVGDWEFAGFAARQLLAQDGAYAGAHYALALVAEHNGDADAAQAAFRLAEKYWERADADLPELQVIRRERK